MWIVKAKGCSTGKTYIYEVSAPWNAREVDVIEAAYRQHGNLKAQNMVPEFLAPSGYTVEWNNG